MIKQSNQLIEKAMRLAKTEKTENAENTTYTIPVVVHILHKGEPVGTGWNITDEQVQSQIQVLNEDFNRLNADTVNTRNEFKSVAGNINIRFCLATIDPNCEFTNGITRQTAIKRNQFGAAVGFGIEDDVLIKSFNLWPTDQYLNIWVCDLVGFVGYATFPFIPQLNLPDAEIDRTDGVVIQTTAFGRNIPGRFFNLKQLYNRGRTTTHEVGHWLGLFHTWGTTTCSNQIGCVCGDDFCDDTPETDGPLTLCQDRSSTCSGRQVTKMGENYMDYTPDACMNIFTKDQVARMQTVLQLNERRKKIMASGLCSETQPTSFDIPANEQFENTSLSPNLWRNSERYELVTNPFTGNFSLNLSDTNTLVSNVFKHTSNQSLFLDLEIYTTERPVLEIFLSDRGCSENWRRVAILDWSLNRFVGARLYRLSNERYRVLIPVPSLNAFRRLRFTRTGADTNFYIEKVKLSFSQQEVQARYNEFQQPCLTYEFVQPSTSELTVFDVYGQKVLNKKMILEEQGNLTANELGIYSRGVYLVRLQTESNLYTFKLVNP